MQIIYLRTFNSGKLKQIWNERKKPVVAFMCFRSSFLYLPAKFTVSIPTEYRATSHFATWFQVAAIVFLY
jgi:hypothetical protein